MAILLAVCVVVLAVGWLYTIVKNNELHHRVEAYKALHSKTLREARDWESKAHNHRLTKLELEGDRQLLEKVTEDFKELSENFWKHVNKQVVREKENLTNQMAVKLAPESHNVHQTDVEDLILHSPDPIWKFIAENRDLLKLWEQKRLDIVNTLPHYRYSHFATWLANFCEGHFNRADVERAINQMEVVRGEATVEHNSRCGGRCHRLPIRS